MILGLDPGPTHSALVLYEPRTHAACEWMTIENAVLRARLRAYHRVAGDVLVIEQIASFGMPTGAELFETCFESGRFAEVWRGDFERIKRVPVKVHLCGTPNAKDANIRRALMDRFGGDASVKKHGALYKMKGDEWAALAVAVTWADLRSGEAVELARRALGVRQT